MPRKFHRKSRKYTGQGKWFLQMQFAKWDKNSDAGRVLDDSFRALGIVSRMLEIVSSFILIFASLAFEITNVQEYYL